MSQSSPERIVIATRESRLALWQAEHIKARLEALHPGCRVELLGMTTRGDQILDALRSDDTDLVPNSKILIMTNFEQDDRAKAEVTGRVDGYLIKADITPRKLLEVIQEMDSGKKVGDLTQR